jgi:transposase InsO family protein
MRERVRFVADVERAELTVKELCERYAVSRKTGYKWLARYERKGPEGLVDLSRRPHESPGATDRQIVAALEELRRRHPTWGAGKLLKVLGRREPRWKLPQRSTGCAILKRAGLVRQRRSSVKRGHPGPPLSVMDEPNAVWCADFKGHFKTRDGLYCYPLTITDGFSRYLLGCQGLRSTRVELAKPVFARVFEEYGLPRVIRTDNGAPFATTALGRLSSLSVWWIRLGIEPELIEPASPAQNGRHERMHKTLKAETTRPPSGSLAAQQVRFNRFRREYNEERPHEALDQETPGSFYDRSARQFPRKLPDIEYPRHYELRYVSENGAIRWKRAWVGVTTVLAHEYVGLEEVGDGLWDVYFSRLRLGRLDERRMQIEDPYGRWTRWQAMSPMSSNKSVTHVPD